MSNLIKIATVIPHSEFDPYNRLITLPFSQEPKKYKDNGYGDGLYHYEPHSVVDSLMKTIQINGRNSNSTDDLYCGMVLQSDVTQSKPLQDIHRLFGDASALALQDAVSLTNDFIITVDTMPTEKSHLLLSLHDVITREKKMLEHDLRQLEKNGCITPLLD